VIFMHLALSNLCFKIACANKLIFQIPIKDERFDINKDVSNGVLMDVNEIAVPHANANNIVMKMSKMSLKRPPQNLLIPYILEFLAIL